MSRKLKAPISTPQWRHLLSEHFLPEEERPVSIHVCTCRTLSYPLRFSKVKCPAKHSLQPGPPTSQWTPTPPPEPQPPSNTPTEDSHIASSSTRPLQLYSAFSIFLPVCQPDLPHTAIHHAHIQCAPLHSPSRYQLHPSEFISVCVPMGTP